MAECDRLQLGQPVAAVGGAATDRPLVAHQLAAAVGEDRRTADQTRPLLLAPLGRESSCEAALRKHAVQDRGTTIASGAGEPQTGSDFGDEGGRGRKSV